MQQFASLWPREGANALRYANSITRRTKSLDLMHMHLSACGNVPPLLLIRTPSFI